MAARVMLGVFEAGFGPAIPLYFCERDHCCYVNNRIHIFPTAFYYTKEEMGQRVSVIYSSISTQVLNLYRWPGGLVLQP